MHERPLRTPRQDELDDESYVERAKTSTLINIIATPYSVGFRRHLVKAAEAELDFRIPPRRA